MLDGTSSTAAWHTSDVSGLTTSWWDATTSQTSESWLWFSCIISKSWAKRDKVWWPTCSDVIAATRATAPSSSERLKSHHRQSTYTGCWRDNYSCNSKTVFWYNSMAVLKYINATTRFRTCVAIRVTDILKLTTLCQTLLSKPFCIWSGGGLDPVVSQCKRGHGEQRHKIPADQKSHQRPNKDPQQAIFQQDKYSQGKARDCSSLSKSEIPRQSRSSTKRKEKSHLQVTFTNYIISCKMAF